MNGKTAAWSFPEYEAETYYSRSSEFGNVRHIPVYVQSEKFASAGYITSGGWHKVNHLYHIDRPYGARDPLLLFCLAGCGKIHTGEDEFFLRSDEVCLIPELTPCSYSQTGQEDWEFYWLHFQGAYAMDLFHDILSTAGTHLSFPAVKILPIMENCINTNFALLNGELQASRKLHCILEEVLDAATAVSEDAGLIQQMLQYLNSETVRSLSMDDMEASLHYSKEHLIRVFRRQLCITPYHYWREMTFVRAKHLLSSGTMPISEIAIEVGFSSKESFIKQFKKRFGTTPSRFRKRGY